MVSRVNSNFEFIICIYITVCVCECAHTYARVCGSHGGVAVADLEIQKGGFMHVVYETTTHTQFLNEGINIQKWPYLVRLSRPRM